MIHDVKTEPAGSELTLFPLIGIFWKKTIPVQTRTRLTQRHFKFQIPRFKFQKPGSREIMGNCLRKLSFRRRFEEHADKFAAREREAPSQRNNIPDEQDNSV
ncbi:hypothetical protein J6590_093623 [Homalodisca vitripennis]|nr:hypothetical protein J6590_093623 [Homalodisca vitripennis]